MQWPGPILDPRTTDLDVENVATVGAAAPMTVSGTLDLIRESLVGIWAGFVERIPYLIGGLVVFVLALAVAWGIRRIGHRFLQRTQLRKSLQELLLRLATLLLVVGGVLVAAMITFPQLTPTKALGAMGIASIAVGLAFQDIFENFFAGILLLWRFPFEEGDFIDCEGLRGKVEKVTVRNTLLRRSTGELLIVPNSTLFKNPVDVLTDRKWRRTSLIVGVAYGADLDAAVELIREAVAECDTVRLKRRVQVYPHEFGASSVDIEVAWWASPEPGSVRESRGQVISAIKHALDSNGVEIPFPQRVVEIKRTGHQFGENQEEYLAGADREDWSR